MEKTAFSICFKYFGKNTAGKQNSILKSVLY